MPVWIVVLVVILVASANAMADLFGTSWIAGLGISISMVVGAFLLAWRLISDEGVDYLSVNGDKFSYKLVGGTVFLAFVFYLLLYPLPFNRSYNRNELVNFITCLNFALVVLPFSFVVLDKRGKLREPAPLGIARPPGPPTPGQQPPPVHDDLDFTYDPDRFKKPAPPPADKGANER